MKKILLLALLLPTLASADVILRGGGTTNQAKVNAVGSLRTNEGPSDRATYVASAGGLATTAAYSLSIESGVSVGFKISQICVSLSGATAVQTLSVQVQRRTTASSGGTVAAAEGTTAAGSVSKMDPASANYSGVVRVTGTVGTAGAMIDQWGQYLPVVATGAGPTYCKVYGMNGDQLPTAVAGVTNGISILVTPGTPAGGLAVGAISAILIAE
jgi:hypothetical protein